MIQISHSDAAEAAAGRKHASCYLDGHYFGNPFILHDVKRRALSLASRGFGESESVAQAPRAAASDRSCQRHTLQLQACLCSESLATCSSAIESTS